MTAASTALPTGEGWDIAIKLSRHTGMGCRYPEHREVNLARSPWPLGSGIPCRNDEFLLNLMAVKVGMGATILEKPLISPGQPQLHPLRMPKPLF